MLLAPLYGDERSSQVLVALELELLAPLEVLLELEAAVVDDVSDVEATASPLVKLTASGIASTTEEAVGEVVVVVVEEYDDELAAVAALVPSPFACRAATERLGDC